MNFFHDITLYCDGPQPWRLYLQDSASPQMEALIELHDNIMFYLAIILFGVAWIMVSIIINYITSKAPITYKYLNHITLFELIELIWTITPALILILIAFPSFKLLYLMDEVTDPSFTVFVEGHQWYWSYQYPDFSNGDDEKLEFDSHLVPDLSDGSGIECYSSSNSTLGGSNKMSVDFLVSTPDVTPVSSPVPPMDPPVEQLHINFRCINSTYFSWQTSDLKHEGKDLYKHLSTSDIQSKYFGNSNVRSHSKHPMGHFVTLNNSILRSRNIEVFCNGTRLQPSYFTPSGDPRFNLSQ